MNDIKSDKTETIPEIAFCYDCGRKLISSIIKGSGFDCRTGEKGRDYLKWTCPANSCLSIIGFGCSIINYTDLNGRTIHPLAGGNY